MSQKVAAFQLENFIFNEVKLTLSNDKPRGINVDFLPEGVFDTTEKNYHLSLTFFGFEGESKEDSFIKVSCVGTFSFKEVESIEDIPDYFYRNAIAILFPYIRSFVSSLTAQANIAAMILPTYNLGDLEIPLRNNTITT